MRERLKKIFISLNKKSAEISRETKIDQATISYMLSGKRTITERTIQLICLKYNVNESWLRTGEGEMFNPPTLAAPVIDERAIIEKYILGIVAELSESNREILLNVARKLAEEYPKKE